MKVCVVTGGSRGLGRAAAVELARRGWRVCVNYRANDSAADDTVNAIAASGGNAISHRADVRDEDAVRTMFERVASVWCPPVLLVNNAGVTRDAPAAKMTQADWDEVFDTDYIGAVNCCRTAAPVMAASGGGQIINVASVSGIHGREGQCNYAAAKGALIGLTRALAVQLGPQNIRVNAVVPGFLPTDMGKASPEAAENARRKHALKRLGDIEETASFIASLAELKGVTGQVLCVDGRVFEL